MNRRRYVAICGAGLAGLAGCLGGFGDGDGAGDPTTTGPSGRTGTTPPDGVALSVSPERLQPGVVTMTSPDSIGVRDAGGKQYLFLRLDVSAGTPPGRDDLAFRFDGAEHAPFVDDRHRLWRAREEEADRYDAESGSGWLLFELPDRGDASDAALTWANGEWRPGERLRRRLASPPPSLALAWTVPESVPAGSEPTIGFEVANEGDVAGRFVAGLNRIGPRVAYAPILAISRRIPPGETVSWEVTDSYDVGSPGTEQTGDDEPDMTYSLDWTGETRRRDVRVSGE